MDIYIYDDSLTLCGVMNGIKSLMWVRRFYTSGSFELIAAATAQNLALLNKRRYLERSDSAEVGYINSVNITTDSDGAELITVSGCMLEGLLSRRVIYDVTVTDTALNIIDRNIAVDCTDVTRRIPLLQLDKSLDYASSYNASVKYKSLSDYAEAVCRLNGCGLAGHIKHGDSNALMLGFYSGVDRSIEQVDNPQVIFCEAYGSLVTCEYNYSEVGACTTAIGYAIIGSGVTSYGAPPEFIDGSTESGLDRIEKSVSVNADTLTRSEPVFDGYDESGEPVIKNKEFKIVDVEETMYNIKKACAETLSAVTDNMSGSVAFATGYKTKWDLGDVVTVYNAKWDIRLSQRITEITEFYDASSRTVEPVFGSPDKTLTDFFKG